MGIIILYFKKYVKKIFKLILAAFITYSFFIYFLIGLYYFLAIKQALNFV